MEQLENHRPGGNARQSESRSTGWGETTASTLWRGSAAHSLAALENFGASVFHTSQFAVGYDRLLQSVKILRWRKGLHYQWRSECAFVGLGPFLGDGFSCRILFSWEMLTGIWVLRLNCKFASPQEVWAGAPSPGALTQSLSFPGGFSVSHGAPCSMIRLLHPP